MLRTLLDLRGAIPAFIYISYSKVLDFLPVEASTFLVTPAKSNMNAQRVYSVPTDSDTGALIQLCSVCSAPQRLGDCCKALAALRQPHRFHLNSSV